MGTARATNRKPFLSLGTVIAFMGGGYFFGDRCGEQAIFYMNLTSVTALVTWLSCVVVSGCIGAVLSLLISKYFFVRRY